MTVRIALDQKDIAAHPGSEMGVRVSFLADALAGAGHGNPAGRRHSARQRGAGIRLTAGVASSSRTGDISWSGCAVRLGAGSKAKDSVTILSGLAAGDPVAVGDFSQLRDGAKIRVEQ